MIKHKSGLAGILLASALMSESLSHGMEYEERTPNEDILNKEPKDQPIPKGMKVFKYGSHIIYAINKKNADKKALKKGLI